MEVNNLKSYLANVGMTLKDFAESIDTDWQYLSAIIHGRATPSRRLAKDVAMATDDIVHLQTRVRKKDRIKAQHDEKETLSF